MLPQPPHQADPSPPWWDLAVPTSASPQTRSALRKQSPETRPAAFVTISVTVSPERRRPCSSLSRAQPRPALPAQLSVRPWPRPYPVVPPLRPPGPRCDNVSRIGSHRQHPAPTGGARLGPPRALLSTHLRALPPHGPRIQAPPHPSPCPLSAPSLSPAFSLSQSILHDVCGF